MLISSSSSEIEKYVMEIEELDLAYALVSTDISNLQHYFRSCLLKMNALPSLLPFHNNVDQQQFTLHLDLISPLSHHDQVKRNVYFYLFIYYFYIYIYIKSFIYLSLLIYFG